jgi:hypothetical protein
MRLKEVIAYLLEEADDWDRAISLWYYDHPEGFSERVLGILEDNAINVYNELQGRGWWCPGNCDIAVQMWKRVFEDNDIDVRIIDGYYSEDHERGQSHRMSSDHVWLEIDGGIFDPTAGQFGKDIKLSNYWLDDDTRAYH